MAPARSPTTKPATELAPDAPLNTEYFRVSRPEIVGPESPAAPFPIALCGAVQKGFGRGGKDLGCPTANLPDEAVRPLSAATTTGVYYGFAQVRPSNVEGKSNDLSQEDSGVYPMAMSLGWNPFYKNERLSAEVHIMHNYKNDFYGKEMRVLVLGYIRPELDYTSREALIADIETDKKVAIRSLDRPAYARYAKDTFFSSADTNGIHSTN
ncbi:riboflavin kinase [Pyrrhoderma noxium]|uniref:Riboflavin kinase n=1 Tax=Pyrrhoderma noxium TaxID=2282107 RepID=A0A286UMD9_9AGAM|nr:riboflavin kinase [Pyrrhoderma noxium]